MSDFCNKVKSDQNAFKACEYLANIFGLEEADFDTGIPHVVRPEGDVAYLEPASPDGVVQPAEVYASAIELAFAEEEENRSRVDTSSLEPNFAFESPLHEFLAFNADMRIPWLFDNLQDGGKSEWLFKRVVMKAKMLKSAAKIKAGEDGTPKYKKCLAQKIFHFIRKAPKTGGLGVKFDGKAKSPQRDLMEVVKSRKATCVEFANLYIAIARQAGLVARPVEVYTDENGDYIDHLKVAVELGDGEIVFFGINDGEGLDPNEEWSFISMNDLMAHDLNARSMLDCPEYGSKGAIECKGSYLERALDFSPGHYMALRNMALWYYKQGDLESSLEYYLKSRDEYPDYPNTRNDLSKIYLKLGKYAEAEKECEAYKVLTGQQASCE
jgi:tetratricopeptide (TPR) repeat protein